MFHYISYNRRIKKSPAGGNDRGKKYDIGLGYLRCKAGVSITAPTARGSFIWHCCRTEIVGVKQFPNIKVWVTCCARLTAFTLKSLVCTAFIWYKYIIPVLCEKLVIAY